MDLFSDTFQTSYKRRCFGIMEDYANRLAMMRSVLLLRPLLHRFEQQITLDAFISRFWANAIATYSVKHKIHVQNVVRHLRTNSKPIFFILFCCLELQGNLVIIDSHNNNALQIAEGLLWRVEKKVYEKLSVSLWKLLSPLKASCFFSSPMNDE